MKVNYDVLIVGGGPAGLSAALAVGRMGRSALICDDGRPRNADSQQLNNFPSQDGIHPGDWKEKVRKNLKRYSTIKIENKSVRSIKKVDNTFESFVGDEVISTRKVILAYGIKEQLPNISGFKELWGKSVLHCTFCHGLEVKNEKLGFIIDSQNAVNVLPSIYELSKDLIIFTEGNQLSSEIKDKILKKNILIIENKINRLVYDGTNLKSVILDDESVISRDRLFLTPKIPYLMKSDLGEILGCEKIEAGLFKVSIRNETTVSGVFAAGDIMGMVHTVLLSAAAGNLAGAAAISSILGENF